MQVHIVNVSAALHNMSLYAWWYTDDLHLPVPSMHGMSAVPLVSW